MKSARFLGVVLLAVATSVGLVAPAVAAPYGPRTGDATVSKTRVVQGGTVRISGDGFCAGASVRVTATKNGNTYRSKTIHANASGRASTTLRLTVLGVNHLKMVGFYGCVGPNHGTLTLKADVNVVPHKGKLHVSDDNVRKGATVTVWGNGFCNRASVKVRVYDDGNRYQAKKIKANSNGRATTSIKLTRAGRTTITFQGCAKGGGEVLKSTTVKVRQGNSFRSSPIAYAGDLAGSVSPGGYALAGGALMLLFGASQLMFARRRRSS